MIVASLIMTIITVNVHEEKHSFTPKTLKFLTHLMDILYSHAFISAIYNSKIIPFNVNSEIIAVFLAIH